MDEDIIIIIVFLILFIIITIICSNTDIIENFDLPSMLCINQTCLTENDLINLQALSSSSKDIINLLSLPKPNVVYLNYPIIRNNIGKDLLSPQDIIKLIPDGGIIYSLEIGPLSFTDSKNNIVNLTDINQLWCTMYIPQKSIIIQYWLSTYYERNSPTTGINNVYNLQTRIIPNSNYLNSRRSIDLKNWSQLYTEDKPTGIVYVDAIGNPYIYLSGTLLNSFSREFSVVNPTDMYPPVLSSLVSYNCFTTTRYFPWILKSQYNLLFGSIEFFTGPVVNNQVTTFSPTQLYKTMMMNPNVINRNITVPRIISYEKTVSYTDNNGNAQTTDIGIWISIYEASTNTIHQGVYIPVNQKYDMTNPFANISICKRIGNLSNDTWGQFNNIPYTPPNIIPYKDPTITNVFNAYYCKDIGKNGWYSMPVSNCSSYANY